MSFASGGSGSGGAGGGGGGAGWSLAGAAEFAAASVAFAMGAKMLYSFYNGGPEPLREYVPFQDRYEPSQSQDFSDDDVIALDCTHPRLPTLSHQRGARNPSNGLRPADTSTGLVLNAVTAGPWKRDVWALVQRSRVTTNHFDVDSFLSVWCYLNREQALKNEGILRHMARIGDFREAFLCPDLITTHGGEDGVGFIREAYTALKLVCWLNTLERRHFSAPYESKDCDEKMAFFLERFGAVLEDPESAWADWQSEYTAVVSGFDQLAGADCMVEAFPSLGLAVVSAPEPLHYYSIFSHTIGADVVLTMYDGRRYEVESKYTQTAVVTSRPVTARLDMGPLADVLNRLDTGLGEDLAWTANRFTDSGPLLRIDTKGRNLTKAQRYGHPTERPIHPSSLPPAKVAAVVRSFMEYGLAAAPPPRPGGFSWSELHEINAAIPWESWASAVLAQECSGQLDNSVFLDRTPARRRTATSTPGGAPAAAAAALGNSGGGGGGVGAVELSTAQPGGGWGGGFYGGEGAAAARPPRPGTSGPSYSSGGGARPGPESANAALRATAGGVLLPHSSSTAPLPLPPAAGAPSPVLSQPSSLLTDDDARSLAASLPAIHRGAAEWTLLYSTFRDGTSLHTLLRKAAGAAPAVLLVRDSGGALFGAYIPEQLHLAPRFFGTGETFVFSLHPRRAAYPWAQVPGVANDFFLHVSPEGLGIGGAGHWAVFLDEELLRGSSGECATFASPCLASGEEFEVRGVELWRVH